jgi:hypothetical protein
MRTTFAEHVSDGRDNDAANDEQDLARDNPRRRREPRDERDAEEGTGMSRSPLRHGVQHG